MKIMHLVNEFGNIGNGIVNVCCDLACEQAKLGHDVMVLSKNGDFVDLLELNRGKFKLLNQERKINNIFKMLVKIDSYFKEFQPDIINCHMMTGLILAKIFQRKYKYKIVSTVHNVYQKSSFLMRYSDALVCLSPSILEYFKLKGVSENKLYVIENGVIGSPRRLGLDKIKPFNLEHPAIVSVGAVCHRKGTDILIKALEVVHKNGINAHLYLVGNIDWPELQESILGLEIEKFIHFQGLDKQPQKYLLDADLYVLASRRETFPLSLLEAKEYGVPIISSEIDGCPDALDHGGSGILFESENHNELAEKIFLLLTDKKLNASFREKSISSSVRYTVFEMSKRYLELYHNLIKSK